MKYPEAYKQAKRLSLENKDKHYCIVVECVATSTRCYHNYKVIIGGLDGTEPTPTAMPPDHACAGSFINGDLWGF